MAGLGEDDMTVRAWVGVTVGVVALLPGVILLFFAYDWATINQDFLPGRAPTEELIPQAWDTTDGSADVRHPG